MVNNKAYRWFVGTGKIGGLAGTASRSALVNRFGLTGAFFTIGISASVAAFIAALFLQETMGDNVMEKCDEEFERYLEDCGFDVQVKDNQSDEEP